MTLLNEIPFIRILLPFLLGIFCYLSLQININLYPYLLFLLIAAVSTWILIKKNVTKALKTSFAVTIQLFLMALGYHVCYAQNDKNSISHYTQKAALPEKICAQIVSVPAKGEKTIKAELALQQAVYGNKLVQTDGKILAYFSNEIKQPLQYGDLLLIDAKLRETEAPKNPGAFDYKNSLARKNIFHTIYIKPAQVKILANKKVHLIQDFAIYIKLKLLALLKQNGLSGQELAIASSLLLGHDDEIDKELSNAYAVTGTVHVLSVSGLHIGIVFLVLNTLFGFLDKRTWGTIVKGLLVLSGVWLFALVSGFSPSVVRAAVMFSLFIIGKTFKWQGNIFNTLLASAFLILLFNPFLVYDIGFQLSYLALAGILFFQPYIYKWFELENYLLDKVWALTSVSLAAQLTTFPLTIYYFNNFSISFIIANLLIIPLSTIIMYGGMLVLISSFASALSSFFAQLLQWVIRFMNDSAVFLSKIPGSSINGLCLTLPEMILLYLLLIFASAFFIERSRKYLYATCFCSIALLLIFNISLLNREPEELTVYHQKGKTCIQLFSLNNSILVGEKNQDSDKNEVLHQTHYSSTFPFTNNRLIILNSFRILVLNKTDSLPAECNPDLILLSNCKKTNVIKLANQFPGVQIVADGSNTPGKVNKWNNVADSLHLKFWSTAKKGAYRVYKNETENWR